MKVINNEVKLAKVLVTGATGFIGSALVARLLRDGYSVRVISRKQCAGLLGDVEMVNADLLHASHALDLAVKDCDFIFHCAGELNKIDMMKDVHVNGISNLMSAAIKHGRIKHWVQLSSVGAYGKIHIHENVIEEITEDSSLAPKGEYEITKTIADNFLIYSSSKHGFYYSILRPSNVVGKEMPNQSFKSLLKAIKNGRFFYIGTKDSIANYVHICDVVDALVLCLSKPAARNQVFNISNDCKLSDIVASISFHHGKAPSSLCLPQWLLRAIVRCIPKFFNFPLSQSRINALISRTHYSTAKINEYLEFLPRHSIPEFAVKYLNESVEK